MSPQPIGGGNRVADIKARNISANNIYSRKIILKLRQVHDLLNIYIYIYEKWFMIETL